ncbi:ankyrin repeat domain-containing protein [Wolbachia endosymbiont of Ctenocephalides felis wCfeT]|uniref:ankyrin repeat domain-containing protein n=1 Tax=Wolbachia endosymbiont of Ctenocephalides felis wCfeT TaxID=2732593 RepID=UPI001444DB4F|nr:ankyrin repeat domain-containing protein [Wolbachia endosymbiont of Ctenocephalides felis wCfeT]
MLSNKELRKLNEDLFYAVKQGDLNSVKGCIDKGADFKAITKSGNTTLHLAAYWGNLDVVQYLIEIGIDINAS